MDQDVIGFTGQGGVFKPDMPGFGGTHRLADGLAHPAELVGHFGHGQIATENGLVTDHQPLDMIIAIGIGNQVGDFLLIGSPAFVQPGACGHPQPVFPGQAGNLLQAVGRGIGAHSPGLVGDQIQVGINIGRAGITPGVGIVIGAVGAE